jgi:hypothetical protein
MAKISVQVKLVYTDKHSIKSTYNVDWNPRNYEFEDFMVALMNTLVSLEDKNTFDKIDILGIDIVEANDDEKKDISTFKKKNDIK